MNAAIPRAFDDAGWAFVASFLLIHLGRTVWLLGVGLDRVNQEHFVSVGGDVVPEQGHRHRSGCQNFQRFA
ncbi:hypothetical protein AB0H00_03110 [Nocardia sp. NPDC023852]|uniref:hypothetical protein n=1 Tax=Nocardia sp. NPDC023852 TaxID=3154697 RepID=UPI0033D2E983